MPRFLLHIQYDGERFFGWQRQKQGHVSVQESVEQAISDLTGSPTAVLGAGRTDRGVHARSMPAQTHLETRLRGEELRRAIDVRLPQDIALLSIEEVPESFHCRYHAVGKCYAYRWHCSRKRSPLARRNTHFEPRRLDADAIEAAAQVLVGTHDFAAFATLLSEHEGRLTTQPDPDNPDKPVGNVRTLHAAGVMRFGDGLTLFLFGDGFLRGMVRGIAGTLIDAGLGKLSVNDVRSVLASGDRRNAGANLPACGLTLEKVFYEASEMQDWMEAMKPKALTRAAAPLDGAPPELL